jgi:hypothetical protein
MQESISFLGMEEQVKVYRMPPQTWHKNWLKALPSSILQQLILVAAIFLIGTFSIPNSKISVSMVAMVVIVLNVIGLVSHRVASARLNSYEFTISDENVTERMSGSPDVVIQRQEITEMVDAPRSGLYIKTASRSLRIVVPPSIEGYQEIKERLSQWKAITEAPMISIERLPRGVASVSLVGAFALLTFTRTPWTVVPAALFLSTITLWAAIGLLRRSKMLLVTRIVFVLVFLALLVWIAMRVIFSLSA